MGTIHRSRKQELLYRKKKKQSPDSDVCAFCDEKALKEEIISATDLFLIVLNRFPYTLWDSATVSEHLMVVPKRHIQSISSFTKKEVEEFYSIISSYEKDGYDIYSRGNNSNMKSVAHQHSHLIKTTGEKIKGVFYNESPLIHVIY